MHIYVNYEHLYQSSAVYNVFQSLYTILNKLSDYISIICMEKSQVKKYGSIIWRMKTETEVLVTAFIFIWSPLGPH